MQNASLQYAIQLARNGHKDEALRILFEVVKEEPRNEKAWLWLADSLASRDHRLAALLQGLKENPASRLLQEALQILQPDATATSVEDKASPEKIQPSPSLEPAISRLEPAQPPEPTTATPPSSPPGDDQPDHPAPESTNKSKAPGWILPAMVLLGISTIVIVAMIFWIWKNLPTGQNSIFQTASSSSTPQQYPTLTLLPLISPSLTPPPLPTKTVPPTPTFEPSVTLQPAQGQETPAVSGAAIPGLTPQGLITYLETSPEAYTCDGLDIYASYGYGLCQAEPGWNVMITIEFHGDTNSIRSIDVVARSTKRNFAPLDPGEIQNTLAFVSQLRDIPYTGSQRDTFMTWWAENAPSVVESGGEYSQSIGDVLFTISKEDPAYVINLRIGVYN